MDSKANSVTIGVAVRYEEADCLKHFVQQAAEAARLLDAHTESEVCFCLNGASPDTKRYLDEALRELSDPDLHFDCIESSPGKIRAQAAIAQVRKLNGLLLFVDADVEFETDLFLRLYRFMQQHTAVHACYAEVEALSSVAAGTFARLQNSYYRNRHRLRPRAYLHGRCFMLRSWIDAFASLRSPLAVASAERDHQLGLNHGPIVDDIHYSRVLVHAFGRDSIALVPDARVRFVPPHSPAELYRDSCRTELELARLDVLFPEHAAVAQEVFNTESGKRRCWHALRQAGLSTAAYVAIERAMRRVARYKVRRRVASLSEGGISPSVPPHSEHSPKPTNPSVD